MKIYSSDEWRLENNIGFYKIIDQWVIVQSYTHIQ